MTTSIHSPFERDRVIMLQWLAQIDGNGPYMSPSADRYLLAFAICSGQK